jgi:hypothetical protein
MGYSKIKRKKGSGVAAVRKISGDPIVIVILDLPIDQYTDSLYSVMSQLDQFASETGQLYAVIDMRHQNLDYSDMLLILSEQRDVPGSITDPRVFTLIAGTHPMLKVLVKKAEQLLDIEIPLVDTLDAALDLARSATT